MIQLLGCMVMMGLVTGCAFTRTPVTMTLAPTVDRPVQEPARASLEVEAVQDSRLVKDGTVLIHKKNGYGQTTSGAYVTEKTIAEIFQDGLNTALQKNGFETTNGTHYVLHSEIQSSDYDVMAGFWKGTLITKLTVRFEMSAGATNLPVWHETYKGQDSCESTWGSGQFVANCFTRASEDVIRQLVSDRIFRSYFEGQPATAP